SPKREMYPLRKNLCHLIFLDTASPGPYGPGLAVFVWASRGKSGFAGGAPIHVPKERQVLSAAGASNISPVQPQGRRHLGRQQQKGRQARPGFLLYCYRHSGQRRPEKGQQPPSGPCHGAALGEKQIEAQDQGRCCQGEGQPRRPPHPGDDQEPECSLRREAKKETESKLTFHTVPPLNRVPVRVQVFHFYYIVIII